MTLGHDVIGMHAYESWHMQMPIQPYKMRANMYLKLIENSVERKMKKFNIP